MVVAGVVSDLGVDAGTIIAPASNISSETVSLPLLFGLTVALIILGILWHLYSRLRADIESLRDGAIERTLQISNSAVQTRETILEFEIRLATALDNMDIFNHRLSAVEEATKPKPPPPPQPRVLEPEDTKPRRRRAQKNGDK